MASPAVAADRLVGPDRSIAEKPLQKEPGGMLSLGLHCVYAVEHFTPANALPKVPTERLHAYADELRKVLHAVDSEIAHRAAAPPAPMPPPGLAMPLTTLLHEDARSPARLLRSMTEVTPFAFSFPLLTPQACADLMHAALAVATDAPRRHTPCRAMGADALMASLLSHLAPLLAQLFPREGAQLDAQYSYIMHYGDAAVAAAHAGPSAPVRRGLIRHTDDSDVTVNVVLGRQFTGGDVLLYGLRGEGVRKEAKLAERVHLPVGHALVHLGTHLHAVTDVAEGERFTLIMWCRNHALRARVCPCCIVHRRLAGECICDASLN